MNPRVVPAEIQRDFSRCIGAPYRPNAWSAHENNPGLASRL